MNFVIAGRDTTAQCLSWAFYLLSKHPEVQAKLCAEIDRELNGVQQPTYQVVQSMKYGQAVISEVLRLYPSVPKDGKWAVNPDRLPDGTYIPGNCWVTYLPYVMGRLPELWGEDAEQFRPERWLEMDQQPSPFKFTAFQAGPRTCLGQNMAYLEAKTVLCLILHKYVLSLSPDAPPVTYQNNITLPMKNGLIMTVTKRHSN